MKINHILKCFIFVSAHLLTNGFLSAPFFICHLWVKYLNFHLILTLTFAITTSRLNFWEDYTTYAKCQLLTFIYPWILKCAHDKRYFTKYIPWMRTDWCSLNPPIWLIWFDKVLCGVFDTTNGIQIFDGIDQLFFFQSGAFLGKVHWVFEILTKLTRWYLIVLSNTKYLGNFL